MSVQNQMEKLRVQRAAEWYELLRSGEAGDEQREEFGAWIAESPRNSAAYYQITALARETREAAREAGLSGLTRLHELQPRIQTVSPMPMAAVERAPRRKMRLWLGLAAALAAVAVVLGVAVNLSVPYVHTQRYSTGVNEEQTVHLADGSTVYLNSQSTLSVRLDDTTRHLNLAGEGFFDVAPDAARPFVVATDIATVQAIGTQFNVATPKDGTHVAVIEGKVQVSSDSRDDEALALAAGEAAKVSVGGAIERRPAWEAANATAWRMHLVVIDGMPLERAVEEFNKFPQGPRLQLENIPRGTYHYSGTFDAKDPGSFADFLSQERDLSVIREKDVIIIRARASTTQ